VSWDCHARVTGSIKLRGISENEGGRMSTVMGEQPGTKYRCLSFQLIFFISQQTGLAFTSKGPRRQNRRCEARGVQEEYLRAECFVTLPINGEGLGPGGNGGRSGSKDSQGGRSEKAKKATRQKLIYFWRRGHHTLGGKFKSGARDR